MSDVRAAVAGDQIGTGYSDSKGSHVTRREARPLGLLLLSLGVALVVVDMSIVNLVLPQIARDLELGFAGLQYVTALFSLAAAAVVVAAGDVADRIGPRRAYLGGLAVFLAGSALAAVAPTEAVMHGARDIQGVGGGAALTAALGTINAAYSGPARGTAFVVAGLLLERRSAWPAWRWPSAVGRC